QVAASVGTMSNTMNARLHHRLLNHNPSIKTRIASEPNNVTSGDQRRIREEISIVRDVCGLNGLIRNNGVKPIATTITTRQKSISQTSLRLELVHSDNRVKSLGMPGSSSTFNPAQHRDGPQYADGEKRQ